MRDCGHLIENPFSLAIESVKLISSLTTLVFDVRYKVKLQRHRYRYAFILLLTILLVTGSFGDSYSATKYCSNKEINFSKEFDLSNGGKYERNPKGLMAHNVYNDPVLDDTSGRFNGFLIDFKANYVGKDTYWALCNWQMDTSALEKNNTVIDNGGAYAGLQRINDSRKAIMSFWKIKYKTKSGKQKTIVPSLVYPKKDKAGYFDNEGEGVNYIRKYQWKTGQWYRMYMCSYKDPKTGYTYVDMWIKNLKENKWKKYCTYNTKLKNSCFVGSMSQFMENFDGKYATDLRSFMYKNIYVREESSNKWIFIKDHRMSIDTWWGNKKGTYNFGATETCLWGITCGYGKDSAELNEDIHSYVSIKPTNKVDIPRVNPK